MGRAAEGDGRADRHRERRRRRRRASPAPDLGVLPADHRPDRRVGLGEGPPHPGTGQGGPRRAGRAPSLSGGRSGPPANIGSQRLLDVAARGEVHDRCLWTAPAAATNAAGSSTALVGSPETVAAALLDYVDIGCELLSIRGYDPLNDAIDYARHVLPLVRQELAHRAAEPAA